ncbi:tail collar protein [Paraburkholderia terrae]|uniref:Phage tail protein n=1 Tax=Paraburkholderia terrae TaxID=311230 RepID=A0A2I8ETD8_9BURK|nr:tail collar protein [Paraburkholderia terrae]AUT62875.1 phage tail protein [Paraburkholderia terrae]
MTQATSYQVPAHPSGLDMRTQLNVIVESTLTDNSGPTEPGETYPGMYWGDTTAVRLRRRTNANDGWIDIGPLDDFLSEVRSLAKNAVPAGTIIMWWGDGNAVPSGWKKCDGTNNTPDLRDRVPCGAGGSLASGATAGANSRTLTVDNMPSHAHSVYDPSHAHSVADPGHAHGVGDPGHAHSIPNYGSVQAGADNGGAQCPVATGYSSGRGQNNVNAGGTGIWIGASGVGIGIYGAGTGISIYANGGNVAFDNRPACIALWFLMKVAQ